MDGGIREWLSGLSRREMALLALLGVAVAAGAGLWYLRSLPRPVTVAEAPSAQATSAPAALYVHVAGWVHDPGVYELDDGSRVIDAIEKAGGPKRGADLSTLNLAALLTDAQQVLVPPPAPKGSGSTTGTAVEEGTGTATELVNVNTATPEELETLPGIGEVLAQAIIAYREENGPFTSVDQLIDVSGIGEVTLEEMREFVAV